MNITRIVIKQPVSVVRVARVGIQGVPGANSTVPGPSGADSTVPGPQGPAASVATIPAHYARDAAWSQKGAAVAADRYTLLSPVNMTVNIGGGGFILIAQAALDLSVAASWDSLATDYTVAANRAGKDFYIYACQPGLGSTPVLLLSINSTIPTGYTANNSRKIGGFHCLCAAVGIIAGHPLTGFLTGNILPASIWDLTFRPFCTPEGMVYDLKTGIWVDIYLQSGTAASTKSTYNTTITDTRNWMDFVDDLGSVAKRLLTDYEFQLTAAGSNEATNIAGSVDPVTTGGHVDTAGRRMISNIGIEDAAGAMNQWLLDQSYRVDFDGTTADSGVGTTVYHAAVPGGNQVYLKYSADGIPYLCCNMAAALVDKVAVFGTAKLAVKHDPAAAAGGLPVYIKDNATNPAKLLVNNTLLTATDFVATNNLSYSAQVTYDAAAAANGRALFFDDGADNRLEANNLGAANTTVTLATIAIAWNWYALPGGKGQLYRQGANGDVKLAAGGAWYHGASCGSRSRIAYYSRWNTFSDIGARGCARSL